MSDEQRFHVEIYRASKRWPPKRAQRWRWRAVARNHRTLAAGEAYTNRIDMLDTIMLLFGPDVEIREVDA